MKTSFVTILLALCYAAAPAVVGAVNCQTGGPDEKPCEDDVDSPEFIATPSPTDAPTASPSDSPTSAPSTMPTSIPTANPSASPSSIPSDSPSLMPSASPSAASSASPSTSLTTTGACATQDGVFGDIDSDFVTTIEFGYELEAIIDAAEIESDVLPVLEKAITDSILAELFAGCSSASGRRTLRVSRRLAITGVSQNPEDSILDDVVCGEFGEGNSCVVVSGELNLYSTDAESADAMEDSIRKSIKDNMDSGNFDDVDLAIVRVSYVGLQDDTTAGSQGVNEGEESPLGDGQNSVLIGVLATAGVLMAAVLGVAYKRRARSESEEEAVTEIGEQSAPPTDDLAEVSVEELS